MPVFQLDSSISFPDPRLAEPDGLLAVGGDLSVERLLLAYSHGIFPWYNNGSISFTQIICKAWAVFRSVTRNTASCLKRGLA